MLSHCQALVSLALQKMIKKSLAYLIGYCSIYFIVKVNKNYGYYIAAIKVSIILCISQNID